jgi:hypothetical protein
MPLTNRLYGGAEGFELAIGPPSQSVNLIRQRQGEPRAGE